MEKQFTSSEVRAEAHRHANEVEDMLNAFADLLEAQEKAVPVAYILNHEQIRFTPTIYYGEAETLQRVHGGEIVKLYTHPDPADAERLADETALRHGWAYSYSGSNLYGDDGELQDNAAFPHIDWLRDSVQELHQKVAKRGAAKLATHSAQAQPPAGQFDPGRDEVIRIHPDVAKAQAIPFDVNDGRPTRSAQAQPPVQSEYAPTYPNQAQDPFWTVPGMVDTRPKTHGTQARPAARVTDAMVNAAMRADFCGHNVADALMCGTDWNTEVMRAALEAALAAQENPNG